MGGRAELQRRNLLQPKFPWPCQRKSSDWSCNKFSKQEENLNKRTVKREERGREGGGKKEVYKVSKKLRKK